MKVIFLVGEAKTVLDFWSGKTKKGRRALAPSQIELNGLPVFDGTIIEQKGRERMFHFLFVLLDKKKIKKIPEILGKLEVSPEESTVIMTDDSKKDFIRDMGVEIFEKRYNLVGPCKFIVFLKRNIGIRDVNELASVLFFNREEEMTRRDGKLRP